MDPISFVAAFALGREPLQPAPKLMPARPEAKASENRPPKLMDAPSLVKHDPQENNANFNLNPSLKTSDKQTGKTKEKPEKSPEYLIPKQPKITPEPTLWKLADTSGFLWISPDLGNLKRYVAARNAALAKPPILYPTSGTCSGGQCYR